MFAVVFEVRPHDKDDYLAHAGILRPEVLRIDGFLSNERFASRTSPGWLLSLSLWRDEKSVVRWRTHAQHHQFQGKGRSAILADYHLRVAEVVSDTASPAPLPRHRFDTTETGIDKALSLTERAVDDSTEFESITTAGKGLSLRGWPDEQAAEAALAAQAGRHLIVRVIRDYGMADRIEAPQYFPPR
jgi:heme-degrading monooxygenase HmoA